MPLEHTHCCTGVAQEIQATSPVQSRMDMAGGIIQPAVCDLGNGGRFAEVQA